MFAFANPTMHFIGKPEPFDSFFIIYLYNSSLPLKTKFLGPVSSTG
jgi:hypothetical protein